MPTPGKSPRMFCPMQMLRESAFRLHRIGDFFVAFVLNTRRRGLSRLVLLDMSISLLGVRDWR